MSDFYPSKDQMIEEKLRSIADLMGIEWEQFYCTLEFEHKTNQLFYDSGPWDLGPEGPKRD